MSRFTSGNFVSQLNRLESKSYHRGVRDTLLALAVAAAWVALVCWFVHVGGGAS